MIFFYGIEASAVDFDPIIHRVSILSRFSAPPHPAPYPQPQLQDLVPARVTERWISASSCVILHGGALTGPIMVTVMQGIAW